MIVQQGWDNQSNLSENYDVISGKHGDVSISQSYKFKINSWRLSEIGSEDLVLCSENNELPIVWKTGRLVDTFLKNRGFTHVAEKNRRDMFYIRPVVNIGKLHMESVNNAEPTLKVRSSSAS